MKWSFNEDNRNSLKYNSYVDKLTSVNFIVNFLILYNKLPWKVVTLNCQSLFSESLLHSKIDLTKKTRYRNARSVENITAEHDSVPENPRQSFSRRSPFWDYNLANFASALG